MIFCINSETNLPLQKSQIAKLQQDHDMLVRETELCEASRQERTDKNDQLVQLRTRLNEFDADNQALKVSRAHLHCHINVY